MCCLYSQSDRMWFGWIPRGGGVMSVQNVRTFFYYIVQNFKISRYLNKPLTIIVLHLSQFYVSEGDFVFGSFKVCCQHHKFTASLIIRVANRLILALDGLSNSLIHYVNNKTFHDQLGGKTIFFCGQMQNVL